MYLNEYGKYARDKDVFRGYYEKYVYGVDGHEEFLKLVGTERLDIIKADPRTGYAVNLDRT